MRSRPNTFISQQRGRTGGAIDILQENLGHSDSKTTAGYYQGELSRRAGAMRVVFGET